MSNRAFEERRLKLDKFTPNIQLILKAFSKKIEAFLVKVK